jgi:hypothetical protein
MTYAFDVGFEKYNFDKKLCPLWLGSDLGDGTPTEKNPVCKL